MNFDGYVVVREVGLPPGVHGGIEEDPDGIANIYINQHDSYEERMKTLRHEMLHYNLKHLGADKTIKMMEDEVEQRMEGAS